MRTLLLITTIFLFISCKKNNDIAFYNEDDFTALNFSTNKIIIEDLPKKEGGKMTFHFLIKIENSTDKQINLPITSSKNKKTQNSETFFNLQIKGKTCSTISYLQRKPNDRLLLDPNKTGYILLSSEENISREDLDMGSFRYTYKTRIQEYDKAFPIVEIKTEKITTDHRINIEEAIKLVHGKINNVQY